MPNQNKITRVKSHLDHLSQYQYFVLIEYQNSTHQQLELLRRQLDQLKSDHLDLNFKIIKNSLFKVALTKYSDKDPQFDQEKLQDIIQQLKGRLALLLIKGDYYQALGKVYQLAKDNENLKLRIGYLDNSVYQNQDLIQIAQLPGFDQLMAKLISTFKTPTARLNYSLKFNLSKLTYILKNIKN